MYAQLLATFRQKIESGEWALNERVPTLDELTREFDVAKVTVRHAIGLLEAEGLIGRYRGRGTFVLQRPESTIWYRIPMTWEDLVGTTPDIEFEWLENRPVDQVPSPFHGEGELATGYQLLRRRLLRHHIPYCIGTTYIERSLYETIGGDRFGAPIPLKILDNHLPQGVHNAEQTVRVGAVDPHTARLLDLAPGAPVMNVMRSVVNDEGLLIYESLGVFRGDFVEIHARLR